MFKFRVMRGTHSHGKHGDGSLRIFHKGDVFESDVDLLALHPANRMKFEPLSDDTPVSVAAKAVAPTDDLEAYTLDELRQLAEDEGINLGMANKKQQVLAAIRAARKGV